jgi:dTDP-4-amino-4,6-dideoxygalactose transaminase
VAGVSAPKTPAVAPGRWIVPLSDVAIDADMLAAAEGTLASGWWSMGPRVAEFEERFAAFSGARHAIAVANGTAALHVALLAVGCGAGDEVVLPSLNFVAAGNTIVHTGATPVFCDIVGERDLNLDVADVEAALTERTRAVVLLHYGGFPCDVAAVRELCRLRGIAIVEDAAHAVGSLYEGRACGTLGDVGCFSFFSNKNLPIGEGGMVVTDDDELAARLRLLRSHGMTSLTWDRHRGHAAGYDVVTPGFNYRLDEVRAAVGSVQLAKLPGRNAARRERSSRYREELEGREGIVVPFSDTADSAHHLAVVVLPPESPREELRAALSAEGIQTSVHYPPMHRFSAFAAAGGRRALPRTDELADRILTLPLYAHMTDEQQDSVVESLVGALKSPSATAD